ncbi:MAG: UdgX family uracil-DNA binding protein, partial [Caldimonas sp.]
KMKAFVRFRTVADPAGGAPLHVAWFEPEHHIVEATAPFFARRFTAMRWAILTPERSVEWDGARLVLGPGVRREQAPPADAGERLWLTYYESIFNPARLKLKAMQKEMPQRYWKNLPEARLIEPLAAAAGERSLTMIAKEPTEPNRKSARAPRPTPGHCETPGGEAPRTLPALREALEHCRECPIGEHATQAVPGEGLKHAGLMFVGEQPGDQEDLQGRPFVGPAGQLLSRALEELGVARDEVYITNAVKHFKFELRGKRRIHKTPAQQEAAACLHWLESEIALVDPDALVALGATAARQLMGRAVAVTRERGRWLERSDGRRVLVTLHPSALLRMDPADKAAAYAAWVADLRQAAAELAVRQRTPVASGSGGARPDADS